MPSTSEKATAWLKKFMKQNGWLLIALLVLALIYRLTLLPGVGFNGDTAKFQFLGKILGTPHPTGYPTYILLNALFIRIFPIGSVAFRVNLLSALLSLGALFVLYRILQELSVSKAASAAAMLTLGLGKTLWIQSVIAEVYTLNLLFAALTAWLFILWSTRRQERYFYLGCAVYAFSFGNHMTTLTLLPALAYIVLATEARVFLSPRKIAFVLGCILLSALQYGYILWRSSMPETALYLETYAADLASLIDILTGKDFQNLMFTIPLGTLITQRLPRFGFFFLRELLITAPLPFIGFFAFKQAPRVRIFVLMALLGNLFFNLNYNIDDIYIYLIPSYFYLSIFSALGMDFLYDKVKGRLKSFAVLALFIFPLFMLVFNYQKADLSRATLDDERTRAALAAVQQDALILTPGYDEYEYLNYYFFVDGLQKDKNIYQTQIEGIREYVIDGLPFYGLRKFEPGELAVYVMDEDQKAELEAAGLQFVEVTDGLYRVQK